MKRVVEAASGSWIKKWTEGDNVTDLDFADDIVLIDETGEQLQKLTNLVASCAKGIRLDINVEKTKYMKIGPLEAMWQLKVNRQLVECVNEFCYLRSTITNTGSCDKEVKTGLFFQRSLQVTPGYTGPIHRPEESGDCLARFLQVECLSHHTNNRVKA